MHIDAVPSKQLEGALRHARSQDDLMLSSPTSPSGSSSAERSPHAEPVAVSTGVICVTSCEFDDDDCWSQEDDDIIQVLDSLSLGVLAASSHSACSTGIYVAYNIDVTMNFVMS